MVSKKRREMITLMLILPIKKKWFDMILSGEKKEEYREIKLDKQLVEFLESEQVPVIAKVPRAVALSQAAAEGKSVAEHSPHSHVIPALEELADSIINEKEKKYV